MTRAAISAALFAAYALCVWVSAYKGMRGDDVAGLVSVLLMLAGAGGLVYAALLRRRVSLGQYAPAAAVALAISGLSLGTLSAGESQVGIVAGLLVGVVAAVVAARSAKRRRGRVKTIFISYRRADSSLIVPRIAARLAERFGETNIFRDVVSIELGGHFRDIITDAVNHADALLAVMGEQWLTLADDRGQRRLDSPDDLVRLEIETGLRNRNILVVPLAVGGADIPAAEDLPPSLRELALRNGGVIRDTAEFDGDLARLITGLEQGSVTPWSRAASERMNWRRVAAAVTILALPLGGIGLEAGTRDYRRAAAAALSPDATMVATAYGIGLGARTAVRIWNANTGELIHQSRLDLPRVWTLAWSPAGRELAVGAHDGTMLIMATDTWQELPRLTDHSGMLQQISWRGDGAWVASGDETGTIHQWNLRTGAHVATPIHSREIPAVQWSPEGGRLASGSWDHSVAVTEARTGKLLYRIEKHRSFVDKVAWSSDGALLASGSLEAPFLGLRDSRKPDEWKELTGHSNSIAALAWSPTAPLLASASRDDSVRVWDASGAAVRALGGVDGTSDVSWSPDGTRLAVAGQATLAIWDAQTWRRMGRWTAHAGDYEVRILGWSRDSTRIVTVGAFEGEVKTWNVADGGLAATTRVGILQALRDMLF
jgi:WD40 repeat protein